MVELTNGDFLYQSDQELFLVAIDEDSDSYLFAVHGWRSIDKDRIDEYVRRSSSKVHTMSEIESIVEQKGSDVQSEHFETLLDMFSTYESVDVPDESLENEFAMEDSEE